MSATKFSEIIDGVINQEECELRKISNSLHSNPELAYKEVKSHDILTEYLSSKGFSVDRSYILPTAFRAIYDTGRPGPTVCVVCEYDALPEIGHACGHNLIAITGLLAGTSVKQVMTSHPEIGGRLVVMGTPAEELPSGKVEMIRAGALEGVDVALMSHPTPADYRRAISLAVSMGDVRFFGKASHAAAFPWLGVNALDAAVLAYQNISALRQQFKPSYRVHVIISEGGVKPNIIPESSQLQFFVRAATVGDLVELQQRVYKCFQSAAMATGCSMKMTFSDKPYMPLLQNVPMISRYFRYATELGVDYDEDETVAMLGSTDMGNFSVTVPSIHPFYGIGQASVANHTREFATVAATDGAYVAAVRSARSLTLTALDVLTDNGLLVEVKEDFKRTVSQQGVQLLPSVMCGSYEFP